MEWIGVKDRLPELNKQVMTYSVKYPEDGFAIEELIDLRRGGDWSTSYHVTHWMPLPEPPK